MPRSKNRNAPVGDRQSRTAPKGQKRGPNPRAIVEFPQPLAADWIDPPTIPEAAPERRSIRLSISRLGSELGLLRPEAQSCRVVAVEAVTFADDRPVQIEAAFPVARRRPLAGGPRAAEISARSDTSLLCTAVGLGPESLAPGRRRQNRSARRPAWSGSTATLTDIGLPRNGVWNEETVFTAGRLIVLITAPRRVAKATKLAMILDSRKPFGTLFTVEAHGHESASSIAASKMVKAPRSHRGFSRSTGDLN